MSLLNKEDNELLSVPDEYIRHEFSYRIIRNNT